MLYRSAYTSIEDMPLRNFVKTVTTNDLTWLLSDKRWYLPKPNLKANWELIFNQYIERTNDPHSQRIFQLVRDINVTVNYINIATQAIKILAKAENIAALEDIKSTLRSILQVRCKYSNETLVKDLKLSVSAIKRLTIRQKELTKEYEDLQKDEQKKVLEADFTDNIVRLEKIHGISIDYKNISVSKYISYLTEAKSDQNG